MWQLVMLCMCIREAALGFMGMCDSLQDVRTVPSTLGALDRSSGIFGLLMHCVVLRPHILRQAGGAHA